MSKQTAATTVLVGNYLPAHDEVFDLAETIGETVEKLRTYITSVRDPQQADNAVNELLDSLKTEVT